jgi:hypothetical protein
LRPGSARSAPFLRHDFEPLAEKPGWPGAWPERAKRVEWLSILRPGSARTAPFSNPTRTLQSTTSHLAGELGSLKGHGFQPCRQSRKMNSALAAGEWFPRSRSGRQESESYKSFPYAHPLRREAPIRFVSGPDFSRAVTAPN